MNMRNYRKPPKSEAQLEERVRDWCKDNGWKRKKMSSPGSKGTLDDYFIKDGRHVWIELKHGDNTPTELQWIEINDIRDHGGEAYWANELEQVVWILTTARSDIENYAAYGMDMPIPLQEEWMV